MKRFFILFLFIQVFCFCGIAQITKTPVTKEEALEMAKLGFQDMDVDYYIGVKTMGGLFPVVSPDYWYVLVDEEPMKGWIHKCSLIKIPAFKSSQTVIAPSMQSVTMPPTDIIFEPLEVKNRYGNKAYYKVNVPVDTNENKEDKEDEEDKVEKHTYAVILSGGANMISNYSRYWNDCSYIYQTLVNKYKVPKENIVPIIADGDDPAADMLDLATGTFKSSPTDLDLDGVQDLFLAATKSNVDNTMTELANKMSPEDHLFIYVIDHGGTSGDMQSHIWLWNNEKLYDYELASMLDRFNVRGISVLLGQCFAGGFIDDLQKPGRVIMAACADDESSYSCPDIPYDEFVFQWTNAMNAACTFGYPVYPDVNGDAKISMAEAFDYAKTRDRWLGTENPQYSSLNKSFGEELGFSNVPRPYSLFMRDIPEDDGTEPSADTLYWDSPDIWVRNNPDGIENQHSEQITIENMDEDKIVNVYVRIHNRGLADYTDSKMILHAFWVNSALGLDANTWLGISNKEDGRPFGGYAVRKVLYDIIPCGSSSIIHFSWLVPDDLKIEVESGNLHHCLLLFLSDSYGNEFVSQDVLVKYMSSVNNSNRLAQKNLSIIKSNEGPKKIPLDVRNVIDAKREYNIEVRKDPYSDKDLFAVAEMSVSLSSPLFNLWQQGGMKAENVMSYSSEPNKLYLLGNNSKICSIGLDKAQVSKIGIEYSFRSYRITAPDTFKIHLVQRDAVTGEIVGGEAFEVIRSPRLVVLEPTIEKTENQGVQTLKACNVNEEATYEWFDSNNTTLGKGRDLVVPSGFSGEVNLRVKATSDGVVNYAKINVDKSQGIAEVSPLPFNSNLQVKLLSPAATNTVLTLVSASGSVSKTYPVKAGETEINLFISQMPAGVYNLNLIEGGKTIDAKKITKN